jgi:hypothetical protein
MRIPQIKGTCNGIVGKAWAIALTKVCTVTDGLDFFSLAYAYKTERLGVGPGA